MTGTCTVSYNSDGSANLVCTTSVVVPAAPVAVYISPSSISVQTNGQQQFTATMTGTGNQAVTWSASGAGIVSSTGLFTASGTPGSAIVTATSVAYPTQQATASITVVGGSGNGGGTQLATDSFARANGPLGVNWTAFLAGASVPPQIVSNQVEAGSPGFSDAMYYGGIDWPADQYSQAQIVALGAGAKMGPSVRATSLSEYIGIVETLGTGNATVEIELESNGTFSTLISTSTATVLAGDYIQISAQGTTLTMTDVTRSTTLLTVTDSTLRAGYPGIHLNPAGGATSNTIMANWSGGWVTSSPLSVSTLASDNFSRANSPNLGSNWTLGSGYDYLQIVNSQMEWSSAPNDNFALEYYTATTFPSDQWGEAEVTVVTGDQNGPVLRYQEGASGPSYYFYDIQQAGTAGTAYVKFYSYVNGSASLVFYDNTYVALASSDYVRGQAQGCLISLIDVTSGALLGSYCDTSSSALSGGSPGWLIQQWGSSASAATNWSGGTFEQ